MKLSDWFSNLIRGGTRSLSPAEASLIDHVTAALDADERQILQRQTAAINLVQRPQSGRMTICFYPKNDAAPRFGQMDYEICLATVTWKQTNGRRVKAKIMLHNGRLQSLQGHIPEASFDQSDCEVILWPEIASTTPEAADRLEHGKQRMHNKPQHDNRLTRSELDFHRD